MLFSMLLDQREPSSALALLSGGLDSQLAVCLMKDQNVKVHAVVFDSPFFSVDKAEAAAEQLGVSLRVVDFTADIVSILKRPKHGFGGNMNPCIDCHARMLKRAGEIMDYEGIDFLVTGEVLNERPMSQNRRSLTAVAADSGYADFIVRPLSGRLLPQTAPERLGWIERDKLLAINGRSRKTQLELVSKYDLKDYPSPAGGCRLTEPNFSRRLKDLMDHEGFNGARSLELLRVGRHFRIGPNVKAVVGRDERDNAVLEGTAELYDIILTAKDTRGPVTIIGLNATEEEIRLAASICARYSDCDRNKPVSIRTRSAGWFSNIVVQPASEETVERLRL